MRWPQRRRTWHGIQTGALIGVATIALGCRARDTRVRPIARPAALLQATGTTAAALAALECYAADPPETERRAASARATRFPSGPMQSCISPSSSRAPSAGSLGAYLDRDGSVLMLTRSWHVPDQVRAARARDSTLAALLQLPGARRVECTAVGRVKEGIEGVTADGVGVAVILTPGLELTPKGFERGSYDVEVLATRRRTFPCPGTPGAHDSLASIRGT